MNQDQKWLLHEKHHGKQTPEFFADCDRLAHGEPLAYIIGSIPFLNTHIDLSSYPLIPRPETEYWVSQFLTTERIASRTCTILDLCAGSGCIGVAVGHTWPEAQVDFVEVEPTHETTIRNNWLSNGLAEARMTIYCGDLFTALPITNKYDYILTNPPYIDAHLNRVAPSVVAHEPARALFGGHAGLELILSIIANAPSHLHQGGALWLEHEPEQVTAIIAAGTDAGFITHTHTDQYDVSRFSQLVLQ